MTGYMTGDEMVFRGDIEEPFREMVEASMRRMGIRDRSR